MPRKKKTIQEQLDLSVPQGAEAEIREQPVTDALRVNFMPYAISVIESRAIPDMRDGLKPSHRKVLVTMDNMHLQAGHTRSKCANIAGQVLRLNPHSDSAAYETLVRLTEGNETLLTPLIDGKGNFGKHYSSGMSYSASRYTEARLMPVAAEFFGGIRKNTVEFVDNYDSTMKEPVVLPVSFPNILANPNMGIAVGLAANICSFNLKELCEATIERIRHPKSDLFDIMPGPDFTTGGYLLKDQKTIEEIYKTGRGLITLRGRYQYDKKNRIVEITEIPYSTTIEEIMDAVIAKVKEGKIKEISDIRDESDINGMKIAVDLKRGVDPDDLMKKLYKLTPLQTTFGCNFNVLWNSRAEVLGVYDILDRWTEWRRDCIRRECEFDLNKAKHDLHLLRGLEKIMLDINKTIRIIRNTENDADVIPNLMKAFKIDQEQAEYVAEIKLRNLNKDYILKRLADIEDIEERIAKLEKTISSNAELNKIMISQLKDIAKKYGQPRKTEIIDVPVENFEENVENTVENYPVKLFVTSEGYIKKIPAASIKEDTEIKLKDGDSIINTFDAENTGELLLFTDKQTVYKVNIYEIPDNKPADYGNFLVNLVSKEDSEFITYVCPLTKEKYMLFAFENGKLAKVPMESYETKQNRKKLLNAYSDLSMLLGIVSAGEDDEFCFASEGGRIVKFAVKTIPAKTTKNTQGVQVINILKSDPTIKEFGPAANYPEKIKIVSKIPATGRH